MEQKVPADWLEQWSQSPHVWLWWYGLQAFLQSLSIVSFTNNLDDYGKAVPQLTIYKSQIMEGRR
jgi:hypothetical protein